MTITAVEPIVFDHTSACLRVLLDQPPAAGSVRSHSLPGKRLPISSAETGRSAATARSAIAMVTHNRSISLSEAQDGVAVLQASRGTRATTGSAHFSRRAMTDPMRAHHPTRPIVARLRMAAEGHGPAFSRAEAND